MRLAIALTIIGVIVVLALVLAIRSWRRRAAAQAGYRLPKPPAGTAVDVVVVDALHVATTFTGRPLDRVVVAGLGFRSNGRVRVAADRVVLELAAGTIVLPAASISGAGTATWTIDRVVEQGGLTVLAWSLDGPDGPVPVESSFRFAQGDAGAVLAAVDAIRSTTKEGSA